MDGSATALVVYILLVILKGTLLASQRSLSQNSCPNKISLRLDQGMLVRTATVPTACFTLAFGMIRGSVVLLRCVTCGATYGGPWCWPTGGDAKNFPDGHHRPRGATNADTLQHSRWFFATPQVCWETSLLKLCLLLAARGGVSWTALFTVYSTLFSSTFAGTQYAQRTHFITALEVAASCLQSVFLSTQCAQTVASRLTVSKENRDFVCSQNIVV